MALLLLILEIVGAIPAVIKAVQYIWDLIKQIRDKPTKRIMTARLRTLVLHHVDQEKKTLVQPDVLGTGLEQLKVDVQKILAKEHAAFLAS